MGPQQELGIQSCEELTPAVQATQSMIFCYGILSKDIIFSTFPKNLLKNNISQDCLFRLQIFDNALRTNVGLLLSIQNLTYSELMYWLFIETNGNVTEQERRGPGLYLSIFLGGMQFWDRSLIADIDEYTLI